MSLIRGHLLRAALQQVMLKGLLFSETEQLMESLGEKPGRAEVLSGWLYHDRSGV